MYIFFAVIFCFICILLILIILLQASRSAGMELFGGTQNVLGATGGDILTKITTILAIIFMLGSLGFGIYHASQPSIVEKKIDEMRKSAPSPQPQMQTQPVETNQNNLISTNKK